MLVHNSRREEKYYNLMDYLIKYDTKIVMNGVGYNIFPGPTRGSGPGAPQLKNKSCSWHWCNACQCYGVGPF